MSARIAPSRSRTGSPPVRRGIALVATLAILSLLSALLVTFVMLTGQDRAATHNYSQGMIANQIALSGLDQVVSQLQSEIADPKYSALNGTGSNTLYVPTNTFPDLPQRMVAPTLFPILTMSGTNVYANATNFATPSCVTTNASLNGRSIPIQRWAKPGFLTPPEAAAFSQAPPKWIVVTRSGPLALPAGANPAGSGLVGAAASNTKEAVGRYAYVVYDTSGLLDVNVAGYPSGAAGSAAAKGVLPWADLTQLTAAITAKDVDALVQWRNVAAQGTGAAYGGYVTNWATNGFTRVAPGDTAFLTRQELIAYAQTRRPALTNALPYLTTFSREFNGPVWGPATNFGVVGGTNYNYLDNQTKTTVSGSGNSGGYNSNRLVYDVRVKTSFTRADGSPALVGEPLVKYRFPLGKLALLEKQGTVGLNSQDKADILKYFGLVLASDSAGLYRRWIYTNPAGSLTSPVAAAQILTLDQVAALSSAREPDFFELLKAGILSGSLGRMGAAVTLAGSGSNPVVSSFFVAGSGYYNDFDSRQDFQLIRIGASIIDQWDADSYPTTITFKATLYPGGTSAMGAATEVEDTDFYGVEDLPYISKVFLRANAAPGNIIAINGGGTTALAPPYDVYMYYEVWNPHQNTASSTAYPAALQISPVYNPADPAAASTTGEHDYYILGLGKNDKNSHYMSVSWSGASAVPGSTSTSWSSAFTSAKFPSPTGTTAFVGSFQTHAMATAPSLGAISVSAGTSRYRDPEVVSGTGPAGGLAGVGTVYLGRIPDPGTDAKSKTWWATTTGWANFTPNLVYVNLHLTLQIQFQAGGTWHTYASFQGLPNPQIQNFNKVSNALSETLYLAPTSAAATGLDTACFVKSDPRTARFGSGEYVLAGNAYPSGVAGASLTPNASTLNAPQYNDPGAFLASDMGGPFLGSMGLSLGAISASAPYRMDMWSVNDTTVTPKGNAYTGTTADAIAGAAAPYYADNDGVVRPGDARYAYPNGASPYYTATTGARPVVLNHRFNSVGDLGYAFRDMPWKTIDLSSSKSADGGLLDLFTLSEGPVVAGRVNPNRAPAPVLQALLGGASANPTNTVAGSLTSLSPSVSSAISSAIGTGVTNAPLATRADLVAFLSTNNAVAAAIPSGVKLEREAAVRALAESANLRTWNLFIDVIAQSGKYPSTATSLDQFNVTGERRLWLHVAIDRYTGKVVDRQLETVGE